MSDEHNSSRFCLWDEWYKIEEELAEVAPTVRVQYDAMRKAVSEDYYRIIGSPIEMPTNRQETAVAESPGLKERLENQYLEGSSEHYRDKPVSALKNSSTLSPSATCFVQSSYTSPMGPRSPWGPPAARQRKTGMRAHFEHPQSLSVILKSQSCSRASGMGRKLGVAHGFGGFGLRFG